MTYTQTIVNDESIFPTKFGMLLLLIIYSYILNLLFWIIFYLSTFSPLTDREFPSWFESVVKKILLLLFHVLAHIYYSHFREIEILNLHSQTNCIFAHFMLFNYQFLLIDDKETEVLQDLAIALQLISPPPPTPPLVHHSQSEYSHFDSTTTASHLKSDQNESEISENRGCDEKKVITTQCRSVSPFISNIDLEDYQKVMDSFKIAANFSNPQLQSDKVELTNSNLKTTDASHFINLDNRRCSSTSAILSSPSKDSSSLPLFNDSIKRSNSQKSMTKTEATFFQPQPILEMKSVSLFTTSPILDPDSRKFQ
jgi:hypothetical protein